MSTEKLSVIFHPELGIYNVKLFFVRKGVHEKTYKRTNIPGMSPKDFRKRSHPEPEIGMNEVSGDVQTN